MAAQLGLLSLTELHKLAQQQPNPGSWMWNPQRASEDDDSWEVRAFAEDTTDALGTTWPPRSYTCTFCRREFRSAQALGGHMNVHRRDRARLRQSPSRTMTEPSSSPLIFPTHEFVSGNGLCLLYPFPTPSTVFTPTSLPVNGFLDSTLLSISPYALPPCSPSTNFEVAGHLGMFESTATIIDGKNNKDDGEELDLELRLGHKPLH